MKLTATRFRVLNYRNIDDSSWIPLERVTCFVGRNESGKTTLLKALHKFNPAIEEPYDPQREFPRDRFTAEYPEDGQLPVCKVEVQLSEEFHKKLSEKLDSKNVPQKAILTRYYNNNFEYEYDPEISDDPVDPGQLVAALDTFAKGARRLEAPEKDQEEQTRTLRTELANWAGEKKQVASQLSNLQTDKGIELLKQVRQESEGYANPTSANLVERLQGTIQELSSRANTTPIRDQVNKAIKDALPVFIYFENYGVLDSTVHLPRFTQDLQDQPLDPRVRTINAMFTHGNLKAEEIMNLGQENSPSSRAGEEIIQNEKKQKDLRSVQLNSASINISKKFSRWFGQRRHKIRYDADGSYFRIWVSDNRRPDVEIELESRSKGFQWFFSFYLVFLVESNENHKDAILLLDEPGLHLHPTAQQELITFFEKLSEENQLIYTTHSPFLIDGNHLHRVRPVTEDETGHSRVSAGNWPEDRETIFPLQAAAGYAMIKGLFQHKKNVLVEGITDFLYLHSLSQHCHATGRQSLPDDIYITPCGGTKYVGHLASLFLGYKVRPVVLLGGVNAGREQQDALIKELYKGQENAVLMLSDVIGKEEYGIGHIIVDAIFSILDGLLGNTDQDDQSKGSLSDVIEKEEYGIEDIIGEDAILPILNSMLENTEVQLDQDGRSNDSLVDQIKSAAKKNNVELPDGWKAEVARLIVTQWSTTKPDDIPPEVLDKAEKLFKELVRRFDGI